MYFLRHQCSLTTVQAHPLVLYSHEAGNSLFPGGILNGDVLLAILPRMVTQTKQGLNIIKQNQ